MENLQVLVRQVLASAWRKRWMLVATAWAVCLVGWASVSTLPDTYESHARIYVDADAIFCAPAPELWETEAGKWNAIQDGARSLAATVPDIMAADFARHLAEGPGRLVDFFGGWAAHRPPAFRYSAQILSFSAPRR